MPPASAILSPFANPFYPSIIEHDGGFSVLYYDGIPTGLVDEHEVIANIPDEALDEVFPPTATDAAELDAVDDFLKMLVSLSLIEDREERCRFHLGLVAAKRWEAKRKDGLRGRPHLPSGRVERLDHEMKKLNLHERRLISHTRHQQRALDKNCSYLHNASNHHRYREEKRNFIHKADKCIQQPRKKN